MTLCSLVLSALLTKLLGQLLRRGSNLKTRQRQTSMKNTEVQTLGVSAHCVIQPTRTCGSWP